MTRVVVFNLTSGGQVLVNVYADGRIDIATRRDHYETWSPPIPAVFDEPLGWTA